MTWITDPEIWKRTERREVYEEKGIEVEEGETVLKPASIITELHLSSNPLGWAVLDNI